MKFMTALMVLLSGLFAQANFGWEKPYSIPELVGKKLTLNFDVELAADWEVPTHMIIKGGSCFKNGKRITDETCNNGCVAVVTGLEEPGSISRSQLSDVVSKADGSRGSFFFQGFSQVTLDVSNQLADELGGRIYAVQCMRKNSKEWQMTEVLENLGKFVTIE